MSSSIRALIVGLGIVGERHLKAQIKLGSEVGIYDHNNLHVEKFKNKYPQAVVFGTLQAGLNWASVVHICTPDDQHMECAISAIQMGLPVLCEKPVATNSKDVRQLHELVIKHKSIFLVGNNNRLTPTFLEIKKRIMRGEFGPIISIRTTYIHDMRKLIKQTPWRRNQDFLWGGGVHAVDLALWLAGENESVTKAHMTIGAKLTHNYQSPEDYQIILTFSSGFTAQIWLSARAVIPVHKVDVEVYAGRGTMMANNKQPILKWYKPSRRQSKDAHEYQHERISLGYRYTINREIELFNAYVMGKSKSHFPLPTIHDALRVTEVIDQLTQTT